MCCASLELFLRAAPSVATSTISPHIAAGASHGPDLRPHIAAPTRPFLATFVIAMPRNILMQQLNVFCKLGTSSASCTICLKKQHFSTHCCWGIPRTGFAHTHCSSHKTICGNFCVYNASKHTNGAIECVVQAWNYFCELHHL